MSVDIRTGTKFVCNLPESKFPWKLQAYGAAIIAVNPEHDPLIINEDGTVSKIQYASVGL